MGTGGIEHLRKAKNGFMFASIPRTPMANDITRLRRIAKRLDPTQRPSEAVQDLKQLAVTIMNLGRWEDCEELIDILGEDFLRKTLRESPAVLFTEKPWYYWHQRLFGLYTPVPEMPKRVSS
jgi:hypothetical protein